MKSVVRDLDIDRQLVIEDAYGNKLLKQANSAVDHIWTTEVTKDEAEKYLTKTAEVAEYVPRDKNWIGLLQTEDANKGLYIYDDKTWSVKEANFEALQKGEQDVHPKIFENSVCCDFDYFICLSMCPANGGSCFGTYDRGC